MILAKLQYRGITYWADPLQRWAGQYNTHDGGRGLYFDDPGDAVTVVRQAVVTTPGRIGDRP